MTSRIDWVSECMLLLLALRSVREADSSHYGPCVTALCYNAGVKILCTFSYSRRVLGWDNYWYSFDIAQSKNLL